MEYLILFGSPVSSLGTPHFVCLAVAPEKSTNKIGHRVRLIFGTCLHIRDKSLLIGMANYLNIGATSLEEGGTVRQGKYIYDSTKKETTLLQVKNFDDVVSKIIPFFDQYPILGVKSLDFSRGPSQALGQGRLWLLRCRRRSAGRIIYMKCFQKYL